MSRRFARMQQTVAILLAIVLLISLSPPPLAHAADISFADSAVEKHVRLALRKPTGALTAADMAGLQTLTIPDGSRVKSLKGLEGAVNLTTLILWGNEVSDLTPLSEMKQLKELSILDNRVTNLAPLAHLRELRSLSVDQNTIKDIQPLASLVHLKELSLSQNQISDLSALSALTELTELSFNDNKVSSLSPISGLGKLRVLSFFNNKVEDLQPLAAIPSLEYLTMWDNAISDLTPIADLPNLKEVAAPNNYLDLLDPATQTAVNSLKQRGVKLSGFYGSIQQQKKMTSRLTLKWSALDELHTGRSSSFAYGGGLYVMPVSGGYVKTSRDGMAWTQHYSGSPVNFGFIIRGKDEFIGFRKQLDKTTVWTSVDGSAWKQNGGTINTGWLQSAVWNGKRYVAVGGETFNGKIYSSENGVTWTERQTGFATTFKAVAWGNNTFVAQGYVGGNVMVSKDGIAWKKVDTKQPNYEEVWDMTYGGGVFVAVGDATIMTSKDGVKWTYTASKAFWSGIHWAKDRFYSYGFEYIDQANHVMKLVNWTSKDGKSWRDAGLVTRPKQDPYVTLHNGKQYITLTELGIETSDNGLDWKQKTVYPFQLPPQVYSAAASSDNLVMAGGYRDYYDYLSINSQGSAQLNAAGKWTSAGVTETFPLRSVIWTGKDFFAVGDKGKMMSSADGLKWKALKSPTTATLKSVIYHKGTYYAAGEGGLILSSKDRVKWTVLKSNVKKTINALATNGSTLVAVGAEGLLLVSQNGVQWKQISALFPGDNFAVTWGNGLFVVTTASYYGNAKSAVILTSADGVQWKQSSFPDGLSARGMGTGVFGILHTGKLFVAVGSQGTVYLSENASDWTLQEVMATDDWYGAVEFKGKLYVYGNTGKLIEADLNSLTRTKEKIK